MANRYTSEEYKNIGVELVNDIKNRLGQDKFDEFVKILSDFNEKRIGITDFSEKMKKLFEADGDMVLRLNIFIPPGYKIMLPLEAEPSQPEKRVKMEDATRFLNKIKAQFEGPDDHIYKSFKNILVMYYKKQKSFTMVCREVTALLKGHPELLDDFYRFLPKSISARYIAARKIAAHKIII